MYAANGISLKVFAGQSRRINQTHDCVRKCDHFYIALDDAFATANEMFMVQLSAQLNTYFLKGFEFFNSQYTVFHGSYRRGSMNFPLHISTVQSA